YLSSAGLGVLIPPPHIANSGVRQYPPPAPGPAARGGGLRSLSRRHSNWRAEGTLAAYLRSHEMVALADLDTRRLTRHLRDRGAMPVAIGAGVGPAELAALAAEAPRMEGQDLATGVSTPEPYRFDPDGDPVGRVVAIDLGMKRDIGRRLAGRGLEVHVLPATCTAGDILGLDPTGVFLTNGPGDPEPLEHTIDTVRALLGALPVFGICLGHQVIGLALGATTFKLPFGHHGGNHPVRRLEDGGVEITAQNHGFAVDLWSLASREAPEREGLAGPDLLPRQVTSDFGEVRPTHQNLNDGTLEGLRCLDIPAMSVQYHPEAAPGPHDALGLFDDFLALMGLGTEDR
ncbi:MAG: carbamoyl-phosphate synthase small subunit, partial [bacterium]|nr:carbamoyl-phosphate synthase small subunit [bacterium]